jgi:hypothetical protein
MSNTAGRIPDVPRGWVRSSADVGAPDDAVWFVGNGLRLSFVFVNGRTLVTLSSVDNRPLVPKDVMCVRNAWFPGQRISHTAPVDGRIQIRLEEECPRD